MLDGRRLDVNGVPQELTEEEKQNLTAEELANGGSRLISEESKQGASASAQDNTATFGGFMNMMG